MKSSHNPHDSSESHRGNNFRGNEQTKHGQMAKWEQESIKKIHHEMNGCLSFLSWTFSKNCRGCSMLGRYRQRGYQAKLVRTELSFSTFLPFKFSWLTFFLFHLPSLFTKLVFFCFSKIQNHRSSGRLVFCFSWVSCGCRKHPFGFVQGTTSLLRIEVERVSYL